MRVIGSLICEMRWCPTCGGPHACEAAGLVALSQEAWLLQPARHQLRELVDAVGAIDAQVGRAGAEAQALAGLCASTLLVIKTLNKT